MGSIGDRNKNKPENPLTEREIVQQLRFFMSQPRYKLDNLYVFGWESDCLLLTRSGYWYEFEVKISKADFKNDFKNKKEKHSILSSEEETKKPNFFYYVVPEDLIAPDDVPEYAGLIYIKRGRGLRTVKKAPTLHKVKNDPKDLNLTDKFYYNMVSAINERNKAKREVEGIFEPYNQGVKKGIEDAIYCSKIALSNMCPHADNEVYGNALIYCKLKKRSCNKGCDFIGEFEDKVERLLKYSVEK